MAKKPRIKCLRPTRMASPTNQPLCGYNHHLTQDEAIFDAVVVTRTSPEGRMMYKWLRAARAKLGGEHLFPKPEARAQMER